MNRCPSVSLSDATQKSWITAPNGSIHLVAYIYGFPRSFEVYWSYYKSHTHRKPSKPTQVDIDQILRFSTSFESVSARLALE